MKVLNAKDADWSVLASDKISKDEFPEGVLEQMDFRVIEALAKIRKIVAKALMPSPVYGAHIREKGNSQHSVEGGKLSMATDFFCRWKDAASVLSAARSLAEIGGIGIYTDMMYRGEVNGYAMFHIDLRDKRLEWLGWRPSTKDSTRYEYLEMDPQRYHKLLSERAGW